MKLKIALIDCCAATPDIQTQCDYPPVPLVYAGPASCCCETAARLYPRVPAVVLSGLRDFEYGVFSGKSPSELALDMLFQQWAAAGDTEPCPQGESAYQFTVRCAQSFRTVAEEMGSKGIEKTAVIVHAAVMGAILRRFCMPRSLYRNWQTSPGRGYYIEYDNRLRTGKMLNMI